MRYRATLLVAAVALPADVQAQASPDISAPSHDNAATKPATAPIIYPAEFYAPFRPQTLLDMLARTPGFSIEVGGGTRGLGGNAGNVLIGGDRQTDGQVRRPRRSA